MEETNKASGKIIIVKFFSNLNSTNSSKLITKTLGKVGFIAKRYRGELPLDEEFWKCRIYDEIQPGQKKGCWLLEPVEKVAETEIQRLVPGFYEEKLEGGVLYIFPNERGNWIMPLIHKKSISDCHSILVCLE